MSLWELRSGLTRHWQRRTALEQQSARIGLLVQHLEEADSAMKVRSDSEQSRCVSCLYNRPPLRARALCMCLLPPTVCRSTRM